MKTKLFTILALVAVLQSCKKKEEELPGPATPTPTPATGCYVNKVAIDTVGGEIDYTIYTYNSDFKVTSFQQFNIFTEQQENTMYSYSGSTMTITQYNSNNVVKTTELAQLNGAGYATSSIKTGIDSINNNGVNLAENIYDTASFEYDANGFLIKETHKMKKVEVISGNIRFQYDTLTYVIQNENIVSYNEKKKFVSNNGNSVSSQETYSAFTYDITLLNKSGQTVNGGWVTDVDPFNYLGKKSKNLVATSQYYTNAADNHTYTLNSDGYITSSVGGGFIGLPFVYTYTCN